MRSWLAIMLLVLAASGCASLPGERDPRDPFESFNRSMQKLNDALDRTVMKPIAKGYAAVTPAPVDKGVTNFFSNLGDVWVVANDVMQLKFGQALSDTWRFIINTTFGIYGIFDVASKFDLEKHEEDFGQTLGYWGVGPGPYLVLPVFGPSTIRDGTGDAVEWSQWRPLEEVANNKDTELGLFLLEKVDQRADLLGASRVMEKVALDPYLFLRESYLQRRRALVYDGNPPDDDPFDLDEDIDDLFDDEADPDAPKQ